MSERENLLYLIQALDSTNKHKEMVSYMKKVIDINPELNEKERNLLAISYKNLVDEYRGNLVTVDAYIREDSKNRQSILNYLNEERKVFVDELKNHCDELLELVDKKLLPVANTQSGKLFYIKLKADYCRYACEALEGEEKEKYAKEAENNYKEATEIAKNESQPYSPEYIGIMLNYCVFLFETSGKKEEAISLAKETYNKCYPLIEQNSKESADVARMTLKLLEDNIRIWSISLQ